MPSISVPVAGLPDLLERAVTYGVEVSANTEIPFYFQGFPGFVFLTPPRCHTDRLSCGEVQKQEG